jgi:hypothetical protein
MSNNSERLGNKSILAKSFSVATVMLIATLMIMAAIPTGNKLQTTTGITIIPSASVVSNSTAPVPLGGAGNYAILASAGVTTTGTSSVIGNIGLSPANAGTYLTGFSETPNNVSNGNSEYSTSAIVNGKIYNVAYTGNGSSTSTMLTADVLSMGAALSAADSPTPDAFHMNVGTGQLAGLTLTAGVYGWSTGVEIGIPSTPGTLYLSGNSTDVWIFQIAGTFLMDPHSTIVLLNSTIQPKNIFWAVQGVTTLQTHAVCLGNIIGFSDIALQLGTTLTGSALSHTSVTLSSSTVSTPIVSPMVSSTVPTNASTGVAINSALSATFSMMMNSSTINSSTFTLMNGTTVVSGVVSMDNFNITAAFTPASNLTANTVYTAMITTGALDLAGYGLASNYTWNFTTGSTADITPPTVVSTIPSASATNITINSAIAITFSEAMMPSSISTTTITLKQGATSITGTVGYSGVTAIFTPSSNLASSTVYNVTVTTGVKDLAGNAMVAANSWSFTTGVALDVTPPTVSSVSPTNASTGVAVNSAITITFSEAMNPLTITTLSIMLNNGTTAVLGTVTSPSTTTVVFTPASDLAANTVYTFTITTLVTDLAGNHLAVNYVITFTTVAALGGIPGYDVGIMLGLMSLALVGLIRRHKKTV